MANLRGLIERGLHHPRKIPRYVFGSLVPSANWGPEWHARDGVVLFEPGGYAASPRNRPEFASNLYREVAGLRSICADHVDLERGYDSAFASDSDPGPHLEDEGAVEDDEDEPPPTRALEVGCGYGRLSPWIAELAEEFYGVDPDEDALETAAKHYGDLEGVTFVPGRASSLPLPDGSIDLLVTWTVLQHVDERAIADATAEIQRVLANGGLAICCERIRPPADDHVWPRSVAEYDRLLESLERVDVRDRPVEPTWADAMETDRPPERVLVYRA